MLTSILRIIQRRIAQQTKFYSLLTDIEDCDKQGNVFRVWNKVKSTTMKAYHDFYLKSYVLLLADRFESFKIIAWRMMDYVQVIIWVHQI